MGISQVLVAASALLSGRPVRFTLSREGVYRLVGGRARTEQRVAIGAASDGRFDALIHTGTATHTPGTPHPEAFPFVSYSAYTTGTLEIDLQWACLDMVSNAAMRAPGEAVGSFALESAVGRGGGRPRHGPDRTADPQRARPKPAQRSSANG